MFNAAKGTLQVVLFDSLAEPLEHARSGTWAIEWNKQATQLHATDDNGMGQDWYGAPDRATMDKRLAEGWPEGSERLLKIATRDINPTSIRRRRERADQGSEIDMQAVWRGDLSRAWTRTRRRTTGQARSITIVIDMGAHCGIKADALFWRGASALRLCQALTDAGYTVAIYGGCVGSGADTDRTVDAVPMVEIKAEDQPLDLDKLAALTAMPGYFRTSLFSGIVYLCDRNGKEACTGLGRPKPALFAEAVALIPHIPQHAIIQDPVLDAKSSEQWIDKVMAQIEGGQLKQAA
jgi:hypothetical protein